MLEFVELRIKNLASISEGVFKFGKELNVLTGFNLDKTPEEIRDYSFEKLLTIDKSNIASNGSGKSSILEAISLCLFGTLLRPKITIRELIKTGEEFCELELIAKNTYIDLEKISIKRTFFVNKNKTSKIEIKEKKIGEEEKEIPNSIYGELDKYIIDKYIGISKDNILNYFLISASKYRPFLSLADKEKKELLSNLIGIDKYNYVYDKIDKRVEELEEEINESNKEIANLEGKEEVYNENINELVNQNDFEEKKQKDIQSYQEKIREKEEEIKQINIEIKQFEINVNKFEDLQQHWEDRYDKYSELLPNNKYKKEKEKIEKELKKKEKEIKEIDEAIEEGREELGENKKGVNKLEVALEKLRVILDNYITCPKCGYKFDATGGSTQEQLDKDITIKANSIKIKNKEIKELEDEIKEADSLIKELKEEKRIIKLKEDQNKKKINQIERIGEFIENQIDTCVRQINKIDGQTAHLREKIEIVNKSIKSFQDRIKEIQESSFNSIISQKKQIQQKIKKLQKEKEEIKDYIQQNTQELQLNRDSKITYKNFQNYLYSKFLLNIEVIVNSYLSCFSDLSVNVRSKKQLANGKEDRDEINVIILRNGSEINKFALSSGEQAAVDISIQLCFQHILNNSSEQGLDFICFDECLSHCDPFSQNQIMEFLDSLHKNILFVTHINILGEFKQTYIIKKNNNSKIVQF